jgi:large subunit ribosomal protein L13
MWSDSAAGLKPGDPIVPRPRRPCLDARREIRILPDSELDPGLNPAVGSASMKTANKCYLAKVGELTKDWYVVDARDKVLGRLAARIATVLMGKHKPTYTPNLDTGDFVIVLNADKVRVNGTRKKEQVIYQTYSRYPGGQKEITMQKMLERHPDRVLREAVRRMLPKNALARRMLLKLKLYNGDIHAHQAQQPQPLPL